MSSLAHSFVQQHSEPAKHLYTPRGHNRQGTMCRAPSTPATIPKRTLVQLYAACMIELAVVAFLAFYEPPKDYNKCATAFFALGTTTIDLVLLAFIRCATYIVIAHRTPPSNEAADLWAERLSHVSLIQLTYGITKGVSRALGARASCRSSTEVFDAARGVWEAGPPMSTGRSHTCACVHL